MSARRRRNSAAGGSGWVRESLLNVAAVGGALCILMTIVAVAFGITLIMFKTGSMAPAIPAGSVAVVQEVPAAGAQAGDVVTVERPGLLPVTHRVIEVQPLTDGTTVLRLKGDANEVEDPEPYSVKTVRTVLWSVPGLAPVIAAASTPVAMAAMSLAVAGLVTWVFWPQAKKTTGETDVTEESAGDQVGAGSSSSSGQTGRTTTSGGNGRGGFQIPSTADGGVHRPPVPAVHPTAGGHVGSCRNCRARSAVGRWL